MKKTFRAVIALAAIILFAAAVMSGCGGGGDTGTTGTGGGGGGEGINTTNGQNVAYDCFSQLYNNPSGAFDPALVDSQNAKIVKMVADEIESQVRSGRVTKEVNIIETDPHDNDGTIVISGSYERTDGTRDWTASLSVVYTDWWVYVPAYPEEEFNLNGTVTLSIDFDYTNKAVTASLAYAGYELVSANHTYSFTGAINQTGTLSDTGVAELTTETSVTTTDTEGSKTGTLVATLASTMTYTQLTKTFSVNATGQVIYTGYNDINLTASYNTPTPFVVNNLGKLTAGKLIVIDVFGNTATIEVVGTDTIKVTVNGNTVFEGTVEEFLGSIAES